MGTTERATLAALLLARGDSVTTRRLAEHLDITESGARKMLERMSRSVPIVNQGGEWRLLDQSGGGME